jgi:phage shock protein PspC (stress-responsive transcriptional regulator)
MQKVISINLNGNAYQLDEVGYETLREYLARADRELKDNPDRQEIMADLEQAIADKCQKYLGPHKSVVSAAEVAQIVAEMGPVSAGAADANGAASGSTADRAKHAPGVPPPPKRLYRITDGAMIAGVCNGLAAYFQVDVAIVRIAAVGAALLTKGVAILAYVVAMFVVPEANTPEERAAAGGAPFNAKEVVDRARRQYAEGTRRWSHEWRRQRRHWRQQSRAWRRYGAAASAYASPPPAWAFVVLPFFGVFHLVIFLVAAAMMISLVNTGGILDWKLPPEIPLWVAALVLFVSYQIVVSPFRAAQQWAWHPAAGGWLAFWHAVLWLIGLAVIVWVASNNIPEIGDFLAQLPHLFREVGYAIRDFFTP